MVLYLWEVQCSYSWKWFHLTLSLVFQFNAFGRESMVFNPTWSVLFPQQVCENFVTRYKKLHVKQLQYPSSEDAITIILEPTICVLLDCFKKHLHIFWQYRNSILITCFSSLTCETKNKTPLFTLCMQLLFESRSAREAYKNVASKSNIVV